METRKLQYGLTNIITVPLLFAGGYFMTQTSYFAEGLWACLLAITILLGNIHEEVYKNNE